MLYQRTRSALLGSTIICFAASFANGQTAKLFEPYDWSFNNPTIAGNAFDLVATATFTHASAPNIVTELYYNGGTTWKLRFTGTATGVWSFTTSSTDSDLNGLTGSITVQPNPGVPGFMNHYAGPSGTKWGRTGVDEAVVPQFISFANPRAIYNTPSLTDSLLTTFIGDHGFNGIFLGVLCKWFDINQDTYDNLSNNPNPDFRTFEVLENVIRRTHGVGAMVHMWAWGDEQRHMTPVKWGINGAVDQRLQRYIAARLGPLPGWSMGYGFDLFEWVTPAQLNTWRNYMHSKLGWYHHFGGRPGGPHSGTDHSGFTAWNQGLDYASYEHWRPTYDVYVASLNALPGKPVHSEDRFRVRVNVYPEKDYSLEDTRRGLWDSTMSGGVANIWGHLINSPADESSNPYPNRKELQTYGRFWQNRFRKALVRDNGLSSGGTVVLRESNNFYVFYKINTTSIPMNLSGMANALPAFAVDCLQEYDEIRLGTLSPGQHTFNAPYSSDWAVVVGGPVHGAMVRSDLGLVDKEAGLYRVINADGDTAPATIGSRDARRNLDSANDFYMYFNVAGSFSREGSLPAVDLTINYFDVGTGSLSLQYDATDGNAYKSGGSIALTNSNTWKTHFFSLSDAYFGNRQNGGADFRIAGGAGNTFYLDVIELANGQPAPPIIAPVNPNPEGVYVGPAYVRQMSLIQGYPVPTWSVIQAPGGIQISGEGLVSGWTPSGFGDHSFEIMATNPHGSDTESWTVRVASRFDFDLDGDVDASDFGSVQKCFSGDGVAHPPGCQAQDANGDGDVDASDFNTFLPCLLGPNALPGC